METFLRLGWRYLIRHPWQSMLMIMGITLGVAVAVAIDIANASASRAFDLSTEAITGRATHTIAGGSQGLDEELYARMLLKGFNAPIAPVIKEYVSSPQFGDRTFQLLGVDPFAEAPFRDYLPDSRVGSSPSSDLDLTVFLTQPGAIAISRSNADRYNLSLGESITLELSGHRRQVFVAGLLEPQSQRGVSTSLVQRALDGLLLADIATAQELTGRLGILDRIDLILPDGCAGFQTLENTARSGDCPEVETLLDLLPNGVILQEVEERTGAVREMTSAFRLNLSALSMLALVVGMFLIYNTMTFSVIQRRAFFGTLRCLGVTRREIFALVISEAFLVGSLGAILGVMLGILLGQGAVRLVSQTINDLFFVITVRGVQITPTSLIKGALLGIVATVLSASFPAWEATSVPPRAALTRSSLETSLRYGMKWVAICGLLLLTAGALVLVSWADNLLISFTSTFAIVVGFAMLAPLTTWALMVLLTRVFNRFSSVFSRMATRDVVNSLSRTGIAVAALMVAVSVTIGVSLMIGSFRNTVITWLDETLLGDVYISAPTLTGAQPSGPLDERAIEIARRWPGVLRVDVLRSVDVDSPQGPVHVAASDNPTLTRERLFYTAEGTPDQIAAAMSDGAVLVSEPFANRMKLPRLGGTVTLYTDRGPHDFPVAGIYYDYASTQGTVLMTLDIYRTWWHDTTLTAMALRLSQETDAGRVSEELSAALTPIQHLTIRPNQELRREVLEIFDRTFAITGALQLLTTSVAFIGVLSALLALQLERQREMGILRAIGLSARQIWGLVMVETGLLGSVAGLLAIPSGFSLAVILIYIINLRSFGWTLQMQVEPLPFVQAFLIAVTAALLAGIYPAARMGKTITAEALRSE